MVAGEVPDSLKGRRLISLDLGALIAGAKYRGQFEERLRSVLEEIAACDEGSEGVVLFIDDVHWGDTDSSALEDEGGSASDYKKWEAKFRCTNLKSMKKPSVGTYVAGCTRTL